MADETPKAAAATTPAPAAKRKSPLAPLLAIAVVVMVAVAGAAWFVFRPENTNSTTSANSPIPKYLVHLEGFTVNLADPEETHFLRVTMDLGIDRLPEGADQQKPAASMPVGRIRDAVLSVLTTCKADVLLTADGKAQLKKNLIDSLNRAVPELGVREVYFTEFLVQR